MKKKKLKIIIPLAIIALLIGGFFAWTLDYYKLANTTVEAFNSSQITVERKENIVIQPKDKATEKGFIFYPGGKVAPEAYIPLCSKIAEKGIKVIIVPMPLHLAVFGQNKAEAVIKDNKDIKTWAIGGHSLGGVMAASFAYSHKDLIKGIVFYASYPQDKNNFKNSDMKSISIWGTRDGVADISKIKNSSNILPEDAVFKPIEGGNHGQFGSYGMQKGDNKPDISETEQQSKAAEYTIEFLSGL